MKFLFIAIFTLQVATATPEAPASYEDALQLVENDPACALTRYPDLAMIMYLCEKKFTAWYFTIPSDELPPGFVRRMLVRDGDALKMVTNSYYFGSDDQEEEFLAWQAGIAAAIDP